ncbi:hypothetical protein ACFWBX_31490 [Streptomyces sp. NPDC059991]
MFTASAAFGASTHFAASTVRVTGISTMARLSTKIHSMAAGA